MVQWFKKKITILSNYTYRCIDILVFKNNVVTYEYYILLRLFCPFRIYVFDLPMSDYVFLSFNKIYLKCHTPSRLKDIGIFMIIGIFSCIPFSKIFKNCFQIIWFYLFFQYLDVYLALLVGVYNILIIFWNDCVFY